MQKTFVLGVGAQKSGTTWLHKFFSTNKNFHPNPQKEYALWNSLEKRAPLIIDVPTNSYQVFVKYFQEHPEQYFDFFEKGQFKDFDYAYDISHSYSGVSTETFLYIKNEFEKRNINTKVIFIMRDPINRMISSYKHALRRKDDIRFRTGYQDNITNKSFQDYAIESDFIHYISRYDITYENLTKAFNTSNCLFLIYEDLFQNKNTEKISNFLNLDFDKNFVDVKINYDPGGVTINITEEMIKNVAIEYLDVYRFASKMFPETLNLWSSFKYVENLI